MLIFKVLTEDDFRKLQKNNFSEGSELDKRDGFIHFSTKEQLRETIQMHFKKEKSLVLMAIDSKTLNKNLRWKKSRKNQSFPHFYGSLNFDMALWYAPTEFQGENYIFPPGL